MREIKASAIADAVARLIAEANAALPQDVLEALQNARRDEKSPLGREVLGCLLQNSEAAKELGVPVCQDTGMAVVFLELGQEVHIQGSLREAVNEGVRRGTKAGHLRCSVVGDPLERVNTNDNTPAILHVNITEGDGCRLTVAPKGFGSENMSRIQMFTPAATEDDLVAFVARCVSEAGSRPCPPVVVGVGVGGDFEYAALLAKKALCRPLSEKNPAPRYRALEERMLCAVNQTGVGPQGFGGTVTALGVQIETFATHIAGLPVAVNMGCHVTRHACAEL